MEMRYDQLSPVPPLTKITKILIVTCVVFYFAEAMARAPAAMLLTMLWYPVQRQKLPSSASRTSLSLGAGLDFAKSIAFITMPGVQKPHCRP